MNLIPDLRASLRSLRRQPLFTAVTVLVLALGIGANTAVFSIINAVLLRPLPYPESDRLVMVRERTNVFAQGAVAMPNFLDWRAAQKTFTDLAVLGHGTFNLSAGGQVPPERVNSAWVSANFLGVLGLHPALGRDLTEADDTPGGPKSILITDRLWKRVFGADPSVVGRRVVLDTVSYEVVGVLPSAFGFPRTAEIVLPFGDRRTSPNLVERGDHPGLTVVGRLRPGATLAAANEDLDGIARELERRYPATNTDRHVSLRPLLDAAVGDYRGVLYLLLGAVACVLLVACANVANLQLARANRRTKELAVRAALGATRGRLARQLLTESMILSALGGVAGVLLALWAMDVIVALSPANVPRFHEAHLDWRALIFAAGVAISTGLLVGLWPAWRVSGVASMATALHDGSARGSSGGMGLVRMRSALVIGQVAVTLVLLAGAGLAIQSFWQVLNLPLGFRPDGLLTMSIVLPDAGYQKEKIPLFYGQLLERVRALPGVAAAGCGLVTPFSDEDDEGPVHITGRPPNKPGDEPMTQFNFVTPDYFRALGTPILRGRDFDARDSYDQPKTLIVDELFAQKFFPGQDPIGQHVDNNQTLEKNAPPLTIIGVVGRARNNGPDKNSFLENMPQMHLCSMQVEVPALQLMIRVKSGDPLRLVEPVRQAVLSLDPALPIAEVSTMEQSIAASTTSQRLTTVLLGTFGMLALALATLGLYGVMALSVAQRTREMGIRLALGAQRRHVLTLVLGQGVGLICFGLALGLVSALALSRIISSLFYGVGNSDLPTLACASLLLAAVGLVATYLPARRATRVDPLTALREE